MQTIEVVNKFTGGTTKYIVDAHSAFAALNHYRNAWNVTSARIV